MTCSSKLGSRFLGSMTTLVSPRGKRFDKNTPVNYKIGPPHALKTFLTVLLKLRCDKDLRPKLEGRTGGTTRDGHLLPANCVCGQTAVSDFRDARCAMASTTVLRHCFLFFPSLIADMRRINDRSHVYHCGMSRGIRPPTSTANGGLRSSCRVKCEVQGPKP